METIHNGVFNIDAAAREAGVMNLNPDSLKNLSINQYIRVMTKEELIEKYGDADIANIPKGYLDAVYNKRIRITKYIYDNIQQGHNGIADISIDVGGGRKITRTISRSIVVPVKKVVASKKEIKGFSLLEKPCTQEIIDKMKSLVDRDVFKALMTIGASNSQRIYDVDDVQLEKYLDLWAKNKYPMFLMLGEKLTVEKPINYKISKQEMDVLLKKLKEQFPKYAPFLIELSDSIIDNECKPNVLLEMYFFDVFKKGMKVSKFLSQLLQDPKFDIEFSKILQHRIEKGYIKVSIDPCDFLTMSLNKNKWSSCQNIYAGAYSNAAFSLMCDKSTVVVYKDDGKVYTYDGGCENWDTCGTTFKWNSKQCRELVNIDVETCAMSFNKTYPNMSGDMIQSIRHMLEELVANYAGVENKWEVYENAGGISQRQTHGKFHYKDPVICQAFLNGNPTNYATKFVTGAPELPCPVCGKIMTGSEVGGHMLCSKCYAQGSNAKKRPQPERVTA